MSTATLFLHHVLQLEAMHLELSSLRSDNREAAAATRKARKRAQQDCEAAIGEFDAEMMARHKEYEQALTAYNELQEQIKVSALQPVACKMTQPAFCCFAANRWHFLLLLLVGGEWGHARSSKEHTVNTMIISHALSAVAAAPAVAVAASEAHNGS
jgi:hypothetical protein